MHWFFVSLLAPFVWSLVNHVDKIILSRYFHGGGAGGLMVFVGVVAVPLSVLIWCINPAVTNIGSDLQFLLVGSGLLYNLGVFLYLKALERSDASYVVPFWQLIPVFTYIFGIALLAEHLATERLIGGLIVIFGSIILSTDYQRKSIRFDARTMCIMTASSISMALGYVFFKDGTEISFLTSMFWNQIGMAVFALVFICIPQYRRDFVHVVKKNSSGVLTLNIVEQIIEIVGVIASNFAVLLAPAAVVVLVEYTAQPLFVFIFGVLFTLLAPRLVQEDISRRNVLRKLLAIIIMTIGLFFVVG